MIKLKNILTENFKKGDKVKYIGKKTIFTKLDPNKVYDVQDVVPDGHGDHTYLVNQYPVKAKDLKKEAWDPNYAAPGMAKSKPGTSIMVGRDRYVKMAGNDLWVNKMTNKTIKSNAFAKILQNAYNDKQVVKVEGKMNEAVPVTDKLIMKMKPGSTIKMKGSFLRSILLTKDKYGNWRSEEDPNDILVNRQIAKIVKGKKAHKAGNTYMIEDTVAEATATITLSQEDMDKLHGDGQIDVDGVTITYQEPTNPQPQDEVKESKIIKLKNILNEIKKSDVKYAMKMAFDSVPGNWHKALKSVNMYGKEIGLVMSSYMGPNKTLQAIVDEFNSTMGTKYKIDKNSFEKGHNTSIKLREGKLNEEDYKYKKYVKKAFDKILDAMFEFRHAMGVKQAAQADRKIKDTLEELHKKLIYLKATMKHKGLTEYGGSDFSKITSLQNFLTIDLDKFERGLKDSKHKAIYKKSIRVQFLIYQFNLFYIAFLFLKYGRNQPVAIIFFRFFEEIFLFF